MVQQVLEEGCTVWRKAPARRAAVLVDGDAYFPAVRSAMLKAKHSIFIVGWDVDSRTRLAPMRDPATESAPDRLGELLAWIAKENPDIRIHVLLWDYSVLFALEREPLPRLNLDWKTPRQIEVCLDDALPLGASHHQKIVVIDDAVAFSGGLDLTIRRWDTSDHSPKQSGRVDPAGRPYPPFHDVQMVVDGDAARSLAELVRLRWATATRSDQAPPSPAGDPWPDAVEPDFTDVEIALSRTLPGYGQRPECREVEELFVRSIESAERYIYIENQFVTVDRLAKALARRLTEKPKLECVIVSPREPGGWIEARTMAAGRARFMHHLQEAGVAERVHLRFPAVRDGDSRLPVMVHAKLMIVDDRLLRVGSANINHRSMGLDSECDLVIEASDPAQGKAIAAIRNRFLGEHLGLSADDIDAAFAAPDIAWKELLSRSGNGRSLERIENDERYDDEFATVLTSLVDAERPIDATEFVGDMFGGRPGRGSLGRPVKLALATAMLLGLILLWQVSPLSGIADPAAVRPWLDVLNGSVWAYLAVPLAYVVGGILVFPITVLIAVTAAAFGPWTGFLLALAGSLTSAAATYVVGSYLGRQYLRQLMGARLTRISREMGRRGVSSVVAMRIVPVAPFTLINLVAGVSHVRFGEFLVGTVIGMMPGIAVMTALGDRLRHLWEQPDLQNMLLLGLAIAVWVALTLLLQALMRRLRRQRMR